MATALGKLCHGQLSHRQLCLRTHNTDANQWPHSMAVFPPGLSDPVHLSFNRKAQLMNEIVVKGA